MPELPKRKVGLVSCSGEEMPEGTITRLATLKVLESLRPDQTVTICLPLFLAGGEGDRAFARFYPTIAIDGCEKRCAARGTEMYSAKPALSLVVSELFPAAELGTARQLTEAGMRSVDFVAQEVARQVDHLLDLPWDRRRGSSIEEAAEGLERGLTVATCACGSGIPAQSVDIAGHSTKVIALPLIFDQLHEAGKPPDDETAAELLQTARIYNSIPEGEEPLWTQALLHAYEIFCGEKR